MTTRAIGQHFDNADDAFNWANGNAIGLILIRLPFTPSTNFKHTCRRGVTKLTNSKGINTRYIVPGADLC